MTKRVIFPKTFRIYERGVPCWPGDTESPSHLLRKCQPPFSKGAFGRETEHPAPKSPPCQRGEGRRTQSGGGGIPQPAIRPRSAAPPLILPHIPAKTNTKKAACISDGFAFVCNQASLLSLRVILLFLLAALLRCSRPRAAALSTALTATL